MISDLKLYKKIPITIKNCQSFDIFKLLIKRWLLTNEANSQANYTYTNY